MRILISAALLITVCAGSAARADETGFASMHDQRRESGKLCMTTHFHNGSGSGATKKAALRAAVQGYVEYTAFEYGTTWARWSNAASKSVSYTKESSGWGANVEARPCKRGR